jgi:hypothetical protein
MAKKKKRGGKPEPRRELGAVIKRLGVVEKDVARVRENLNKFLVDAEKFLSGPSHLSPLPGPTPPRKKRPRR